MPRRPTTHAPEPQQWFFCLVAHCPRKFRTISGRTKHFNAKHDANDPRRENSPHIPAKRLRARVNPLSHDEPDLPDIRMSNPPELEEADPGFQDRPHPIFDSADIDNSETDEKFVPVVEYHPYINARPCDEDGIPLLNPKAPPIAQIYRRDDWTPYRDRIAFELAVFLFQREQMSIGNIDILLRLWAASLAQHDDSPPFLNHQDLYNAIDATSIGGVPWQSANLSYNGPLPSQPPPWMQSEYTIWFRDPRLLFKSMLENPDFAKSFDYRPYRRYDTRESRSYEHFMSGDWAWDQADIIAEDPGNYGIMFVPIILGSDKTTVSVATGHTEYWPIYGSIGNIHNNVRRAHGAGLVLIGFLSIPKTDKAHARSVQFRQFRRKLFHTSISTILESLRPGETSPEVYRCPDGHYRRVMWGIGPYLADYPEQVLLAGVVQDWCAKCQGNAKDLDGQLSELPRTRELTEMLIHGWVVRDLWEEFGIVSDVVPFTNDFKRADIHELLAPDLLHQLIKGTFKDHLVEWVQKYITLHNPKAMADAIMDDIDHRIAIAPPFSGLRRFTQGRDFKQWTGDDSKALMKVYLPAIQGHVPREVVRTFRAFLEFCYIARRDVITEDHLTELQDALARFHKYRDIFIETGVRSSFLLPRQHSMVHYHSLIRKFGSPNGLCTSITESKHIRAIKEPWRRSNHSEALGQMLVTNQRLDQLAAAHTHFTNRGMLNGTCLAEVLQVLAAATGESPDSSSDTPCEDVKDEIVDDPNVIAEVKLLGNSQRKWSLFKAAQMLELPTFPTLLKKFLYRQLYPHSELSFSEALEAFYLEIDDKIHTFNSATSTFRAPSDTSGIYGMRREHIRATPSWRGGPPRYDCILVNSDPNVEGARGFEIARTFLFFSFQHQSKTYPCALVQWYSYIGEEPDEDTGLWKIEPEADDDGSPHLGIVHIDAIYRAVHLMPAYCTSEFIDKTITIHSSLDKFQCFYVNKFIDHHLFATLSGFSARPT